MFGCHVYSPSQEIHIAVLNPGADYILKDNDHLFLILPLPSILMKIKNMTVNEINIPYRRNMNSLKYMDTRLDFSMEDNAFVQNNTVVDYPPNSKHYKCKLSSKKCLNVIYCKKSFCYQIMFLSTPTIWKKIIFWCVLLLLKSCYSFVP